MARSPTGTFTLVAGNPVITGTIITSDWANTTMPDIGAALTDSLSRTGQGGMLAPIRGVSGSATAPAHSFTDFPRSGMYAVNADEMRYAVNGVDRMRWQAGGLPTQTYNVATGLWEDLEPVGVVGPNLLDNSNFQIHQRGDSGSLVSGEYKLDRYSNLLDHDGATTYAQPPSGEGTTITTTGATTIGASNTQFETKILQRQYNLIRGKDAQMSIGVTSNATCNVFFRLVTYKAGATTITQLSDPLPVLANADTEVSFTFPVADVGDLSSDPADRIDVQFFTDNLNEVTTFHWVKLEEGNAFTGYEPTPYAIDEAECFKWFWRGDETKWASVYSNAATRGLCSFNYPTMYFIPTSYDVSTGGVGTVVLQNGPETSWVSFLAENFGSGGSNINLKNVSCEL